MNEFNALCYFVGLIACSIAVGNLVATPAYGFLTLGVGMLLFPFIDRLLRR